MNSLEEVNEEASKDKDHKEVMTSVERKEESLHNAGNQEDVDLHHCSRLWVSCGLIYVFILSRLTLFSSCGLRTSVLESEYHSKVAGHRGKKTMKEQI
jgi:hypothetical protein